MAEKKKPVGGRPENWEEICMARVPPWMGEPPKAKKKEPAKKEK